MAEKIKEVYLAGRLGGSAQPGVYVSAARNINAVGRVDGGVAGSVWRAPATNADAAARTQAPARWALPDRTAVGEPARRWQDDGRVFALQTVSLSGIVSWLEMKHEARLTSVVVERSRVSPAGAVFVKAGPGGAPPGVKADAFAPQSNGAQAGLTKLSLTKLTVMAGAYKPATEGRHEGAPRGLTFLRREEQMRTPPQNYAFAQTARPAVVEERVTGRVPEKEVEEIVRKEVATVMKSRSPMDGLSRADYSRLADYVYSALTRRLLMEKERIGLHR